MINNNLDSSMMTAGSASRFIKPRWIINGCITTEAFDLRDGNPPETYVSFFLVERGSADKELRSGYKMLSEIIPECTKWSISIIEIEEALSEINDEDTPFICFKEKGIPHCGLIYLTNAQEKILEIKATLCVLAQKKVNSTRQISNSV